MSYSLDCSHQEGSYRDPQAKMDQTVLDSHRCGAKGKDYELRHNAAVTWLFTSWILLVTFSRYFMFHAECTSLH